MDIDFDAMPNYADVKALRVSFFDSLLLHKDTFHALKEVYLHHDQTLFTQLSPRRLPLPDFMIKVRDCQTIPRGFEQAMRRPGRNVAVFFMVECKYWPYMKGKRLYWHDKASIDWRSLVSVLHDFSFCTRVLTV